MISRINAKHRPTKKQLSIEILSGRLGPNGLLLLYKNMIFVAVDESVNAHPRKIKVGKAEIIVEMEFFLQLEILLSLMNLK